MLTSKHVKGINILFIIIGLFFNLSCAYLIKGSTDRLIVKASPLQSRVRINGVEVDSSQQEIRAFDLTTANQHKIEIYAEGCESFEKTLGQKFTYVSLLNVLPPSFFLGFIVDLWGSRTAWRLQEKYLEVQLQGCKS